MLEKGSAFIKGSASARGSASTHGNALTHATDLIQGGAYIRDIDIILFILANHFTESTWAATRIALSHFV